MNLKSEYIFLSDGYRGGASQFLNDHINYLAKKKRNVTILDPNPKKTFETFHKKIKFHKIKINENNFSNKKFLNNLINFDKKKSFLIITNFVFLIKYFFIFRKFRKKNKIILTIHSGILKKTFRNIFLAFIFSLICRNIDFLIFGSNSAKKWWMEHFPWMRFNKTLIIYNGINLPRNSKTRILKKPIQISFVGRLENENNPIFFVDIAKELLKKNDNFRFNIFGDGPELKNLKSNFKSNFIKFHGWTKKNKMYNITDILIITAPINNFPYTALEAKSFGIPVLSCSDGDISKIIRNDIDGHIVSTNSVYPMISLINKIIKNYKKYSKNSIKRSKLYDLESSCKKFWKITQ
jgi:glycosyltransferase involved in cell wall biosynthesis